MSQIGSKVKSFFQNMVKPPPANVVAAAASATMNTIKMKPHVPLIRFRKGSLDHGDHAAAASPAASGTSAPAPAQRAAPLPKAVSIGPLPVIEDWQLPHRLRRQPIPPEEVEYINMGGPPK